MKSRKSPRNANELRKQAEREAFLSVPDISHLSQNEIRQLAEELKEVRELVHDLHVHQIELKMQNEQIQQLWSEAEEAQERYQDLFVNAPIAYLIVDLKGQINEANIQASKLLGTPENKLRGASLNQFMEAKDWNIFQECCLTALQESQAECYVAFKPLHAPSFNARLHMKWLNIRGESLLRMAVTDVTELKKQSGAGHGKNAP